jgi:predicted lipoprotein with Yx(FWY)xxD motif
MKKMLILAVAILAVGVAAVAASASTGAHASGGTTVKTAHTKLGTILVGPNGHALYLFEADKGGKSACSGQCAHFWPPLTTSGSPKAGGSAKSNLLGTINRGGGVTQVTYKGHPLYYFLEDSSAGSTKGEGSKAFGAEWYVLASSGNKIDKS